MSNGQNIYTRAAMLATSKATIVASPDWHPIRTFVERAHNKPVGRLVSRKSKRAMPWEGFGERHLMMISEADIAVERFLAQPHRLEIRAEAERRRLDYFPDLMRRMADGTIEIVEVKKSKDEIDADPDYAFKIAMAEKVYEAIGWTFRIVVADDEIDIDPLLPNAQRIFADKFAVIGTRERLALEETFETKGDLAYAEAIETIAGAGGYPVDRARKVLHAFFCTRSAGIDITSKITRDSVVTKPEGRGRR
ncbi:MAG: TnsA endonuclease N-terminal domain-containing protein [Xanthobacteraceae bacterium]